MQRKRRRRYTKEFKSEVVEYANNSTLPISQIAKEFGISDTCLHRWKHQETIDAGKGKPNQLTTNEKEELRRLRRENRKLREEKEILKKAAVFFAKNVQ